MSDPVPLDRLPEILNAISIDRVSSELRIPLYYADFRSESLIKIHLLPYLIPLKSERALAFELAERTELQIAVGLPHQTIPSRPTLWHFRQPSKFPHFRRLMIRALAIMVVDAVGRGITLPFVGSGSLDMNEAYSDVFTDRVTATRIAIQTRPQTLKNVQMSRNPPLPGFEDLAAELNEKLLLYEWLDFPVHLSWGSQPIFAQNLVQPAWMESPYEFRDLQDYFGKGGKSPYTACNVLIIRKVHGQDEILLTQRLRGSGSGTYALPGGKQEVGETIEACVRRELQEEVGIDYRAGRPISLRNTDVPGYPRVKSVGVQATEWYGQPVRKELLAHSEWKWYKLTDLPSPLFFPSKMAIDDFLDNQFTHLDWEAIEPEPPLPLWDNDNEACQI